MTEPQKPAARRARTTPVKRAAAAKREIAGVKRRYKQNMNVRRKLLPGEAEHVADMVIVLKLAGYTGSQIGSTIGISRGQVREILGQPEVAEKLLLLRSALPQAALDLLQGYMIEAVQSVVNVLRTTPDDKLVLQAAAEILDRAGLPKASKQERHSVNEDRTTITDDGIVERLRKASPEVQEEAAQIIERLEVLLAIHAETADAETNESEELGDDE